jgi:Uma2 family endonuclease
MGHKGFIIKRMGLPQAQPRLTEAEYLQIERQAATKSEFFAGEIFAMSGGTRWHSLIPMNIGRDLGNKLKGGKCVVYDSNLRVKVLATGLLTYPDVTVACGRQEFVDAEQDTLTNPSVIIEVLSDSTEAYDRGAKFENYRQIPSLKEYLLVSQKAPRIEQYIRQDGGQWLLREAVGLQATLELPSLQVVLSLAEAFANVEFPPQALRPSAQKP